MSSSISATKRRKRRRPGRPRVGSIAVLVRIPPDQLIVLDEWIDKMGDDSTSSRPAAIRHAISLLKSKRA